MSENENTPNTEPETEIPAVDTPDAGTSDVTAPDAGDTESGDAEADDADTYVAEEQVAEGPDTEDQDDSAEDDDKPRKGRPLLVIIIAVAVLGALSFVPWGDLTHNILKDYNLLADLMPAEENDSTLESTDMLDPALELEMQRINAGPVAPQMASDTMPAIGGGADGLRDNPPLDTLVIRNIPDKPVRQGETVVLEDYTADASGLGNLRRAMAARADRPVRIAVIGDSYIEGDIVTADLRDLLQQTYGGRGVGYVAAHNVVQGFRTTVRHSDNGWTQQPIGKVCSTNFMPLSGEYYTGSSGAGINLAGVDKSDRLKAWNNTRILFQAPAAGTITITTDNNTHTFDIAAAPGVQSVVLPGETASVKIKSTVPSLKLFGVWIEDANGVVVDNMSVRGDSGITHKYVNVSLAEQLRQWIDYDLIIVEYGINAMSSKQTDYSGYSKIMTEVLQRLKQCYPNADIIMMGIGDRGQKIHGEPHSFPTAPNMVAAQRQAAKNAGVLFWDTREAMGGEDAVVRWRNDRLVNADYIHLNHDGGKRLGTLLFDAIDREVKKQ